jgi:hypothetical protein
VGYTLPSIADIVDEYIEYYFPKSVATSQALRDRGG